ncbi:MAG TPA: AAA family ATPase, partial [Acidimicrobiales bacterium]|nr:AAA family ATPase [Acidimicrobiales bacterium]
RTRSGHVVPVTSGDRRYTTTELLAAEQRIVDSAVARIGEGTGRVAPEMVDRVLRLHSHLDGEQADGVRALLTSGNGYDLVIGQAGTGKTTLLEASRMAWEEAGFAVIGTAVAARTAADLEAGTGIPSSSLTQLLADVREGGGLTTRHVVVLDEAAMVGTRPLDQLRSSIDAAGAKLVLLGDNRQLSSIDAGGALRSFSSELGSHVVTLTINRRQAGSDQQWERDALVALRHGDVTPAVDAYVEHGRVTITATLDQARRRIVEDWWSVHRTQTTAILAVRRSDVAALNEMVRARRQAAGELGAEIRIGAKAFSVGDRVIFEKNQRVRSADSADTSRRPELVRLRNGTFGTVVAVTDAPGNAVSREGDVRRARGDSPRSVDNEVGSNPRVSLVVQLDDGRRAVLPRSYAEASTSLGYALTVFRSQGITVDHTFGLGGDSLYQEAGYTQLSRGRLSNNLYVAAPENPRWEIGHHADDLAQRDALGSLVGALSQNREQTMARDRLPTWRATSAEDVASSYREYARLGRWIAEHAPGDGSRQSADIHAQRHLKAWVARHQDEIERWSCLDRGLRRHEYRLGQAAGYTEPEHVTAVLGPLPERIAQVERWQSAAGAIEAYRARWNVSAADALGPRPLDPEQFAHWHRAVSVIATAGFALPPGPGSGPDDAWLSSVWDRLDALDTARLDPADGLSSWSDSRLYAWGRDVDSGYGLDEGLGR